MNIFVELSVILVLTTLFATIARLLRQPLLVGYIASGIVIGPLVLNIFSSHHELELFAKFGIAILLFIVGIHLNPETLRETGKPALYAGGLQIIVTTLVGFLLFTFFDIAMVDALVISFALALSSTIVVLKMLSDTGEMHTIHGKLLVGILIVQDIAATLGLVLLPLLSQGSGDVGLTLFRLLGFGLLLAVGLFFVSKYLLPKFSDYLAKSSELLLLFSLSWGLILSAVFYKLGFSIEVGALVAGITLSSSKYAHEISSRLRPLRDVFVALFFVLLGAGLDIASLSDKKSVIAVLLISLFVLVGNPLILYGVMRARSYSRRSSTSASLALGQVSEFSLIFLTLAVSYGVVNKEALTIATLVTIITIIGSSYFYEKRDVFFSLVSFIDNKDSSAHNKQEEQEESFDVLVFGFGRVGLEFMQTADVLGLRALAVDSNPEVFDGRERIEGIATRFGDADDVEFLSELPLASASYVVSTIPNIETNILLATEYRKKNSEGILLVVAHNPHHVERLYTAGVTYVIMPHYWGAHHATKMLLTHKEHKNIFDEAKDIQRSQIEKSIT